MKLDWLPLLLAACLSGSGQELPTVDLNAPRPAHGREHVQSVSEQQVLPAGRRNVLRLRFVVDDGYHINSHQPKSDFLIATELRVEPAAGMRVGAPVYPSGKPYSFAASPGYVLDVYTGAFAVELPLTAEAGAHTLHGTLRYQACDRAMCYPVRSLLVVAEFTAK